ncbi:thrombospondin type 3 repeat-containing protein [Marinobacter halotolerans]|uniref:thrombospondin type 3 repeat-containing protein n=1 Tax=Marinobacter halotolerans TaxID=1569211 RepID=UPI001CD93CCE|nr:thrombospondin type 3 repeat-containing protein [Marinobacter halotolerans]
MTVSLKRVLTLVVFLSVSSTHAGLVDIDESGGVAYFTFALPNKVIRYDMVSESFLPEIPLSGTPSATQPYGGSLYVAYGRSAYAINLSSLTSTFISNTSVSISDVMIVGDALYLVQNFDRVMARALTDFSLIEEETFFYSGTGAISSSSQSAIFFRDTGVSPADLRKIPLAPDGTFQSLQDSPYHGDYPRSDQLYLFPNESRLIDNAGIAYFTSDLTYSGSIAGGFDDMTFWQDHLLVRRGNIIYQYNSQLLELGQMPLQTTPTKLLSHGEKVLAFTDTGDQISVQELDLTGLTQPEPDAPPSPDSLPYSPEFIELDETTGDIFLLDRETLGLFVWSAESGTYTRSMGLLSPPDWMTFSQAHNRLYLGYSSGAITYIDLAAPELMESALVNLPSGIQGLKAAGDYLFAVDPSGAWSSHYSIDANGTIVDSEEWRNPSVEYVWNPITERIYHFRNGTSPNDIEWAELDVSTGLLGAEGDSPYHSSEYATAPLHIDPTGQWLLSGGGKFHDATTLSEVNYLSNTITDAAWVQGQLFTIGEIDSALFLQQWSSGYERLNNIPLDGNASYQLLAYNDQLIIIEQRDSGPQFSVLAPNNDSDTDGISNLQDNCPGTSNETQSDIDQDGKGDACDSDADGDGIPNTAELDAGLDPMDATDANQDIDGDGFSNLTEHLQGTGLNDPDDYPEQTDIYLQDFELGIFPSDFSHDPLDDGNWSISTINTRGQYSLRSGAIANSEQSRVTWNFQEPLPAGTLSFDHLRSAESCCDNLQILIDGSRSWNLSSSNGDWVSNSVEVPEGTLSVSFIYRKDGSVSSGSDAIWIDDLQFSPSAEQPNLDWDGDGIPNETEEQFQALDPNDPSDAFQDYDGDGADNYSEVLSGYNPDQPDEFPARPLLESYFPLGDIVWEFSDSNGPIFVRSTNMNQPGRNIIREGDLVRVFERRPGGIFMMEEGSLSQTSNAGYESHIEFQDGLMFLPAEMQLGETRQHSTPAKFYRDDKLELEFTVTTRLQMVEESYIEFEGQERRVIVILEEFTYGFEDGTTDSVLVLRGYAEDIGEIYHSAQPDWNLEAMTVLMIDDSIAVQSSGKGKKSESGGGGSASWILLLIMAGLALIRVPGVTLKSPSSCDG